MSINLANVDIPIQQFQAISKGDYNAGEVKLSGEHSLTRINHHVYVTIANRRSISHEEVLAIKNAFVRALEGNGVGEAEINAVRRELGLAPDGAADRTLAERSIRPLSRQQIRLILDRNADAINHRLGPDTIRKTAQLQADLDPDERNRRKDVRDETDRGTAGRRRLPAGNREVALFQDLLAGNTRFRNAADHEALLELARRQKAEFLLSVGGRPDATKGAVIGFRTAAGQRIKMAAGCTETEYLAKLDEMIQRLSSVPAPDARTLAVRAGFDALPTNTAKNTWTYDLSQDPDRGFKFRTAAIAALVERGVADHATLSAINRLSVDRTRLLLQTVLMTLSNLRGDALRNHQLVRLVLHDATTRPVEVPEDQRAYIPAVPPDAV